MEKTEKQRFPRLVVKLTNMCDGWLLGSSANISKPNPRDYDVFIPAKNWQIACGYLPPDYKINSFGGIKCIENGVEIDVFTGVFEDFISNNFFTYAYHPKSGILLKREYQKID